MRLFERENSLFWGRNFSLVSVLLHFTFVGLHPGESNACVVIHRYEPLGACAITLSQNAASHLMPELFDALEFFDVDVKSCRVVDVVGFL